MTIHMTLTIPLAVLVCFYYHLCIMTYLFSG